MAGWKPDSEVEHESFGTVQISRVSGHAQLFQSPHKHQYYMALRVYPSVLQRSLSNDYVMSGGGHPYIEVNMSEAQWVSMISSAGMGGGTPCTIKGVMKEDGTYRRMEDVPEKDSARATYSKEANERGERAMVNIKTVIDKLQAATLPGAKFGKAELKEALGLLNHANAEVAHNIGFVLDQFEEYVDKNIEAAKTEIEAAGLAKLQSIALAAIASNITPEDKQALIDSLTPKARTPDQKVIL